MPPSSLLSNPQALHSPNAQTVRALSLTAGEFSVRESFQPRNSGSVSFPGAIISSLRQVHVDISICIVSARLSSEISPCGRAATKSVTHSPRSHIPNGSPSVWAIR